MPLRRYTPLQPIHRKPDDGEDLWLMSYADMMTLLLGFFVLIVAVSSINAVKFETISRQFARNQKRLTFRQLEQKVRMFIATERIQNDVSVQLTARGMEINFKDKLLFDSGSAELKPEACVVLSRIAPLLRYREIDQRRISIEGHTDGVPISNLRYPSNWELSSARAASVVKFFTGLGMPPERFEAVGYADTRPMKTVADPGVPEPANRRVTVVVSPESYRTAQPGVSAQESGGPG